MKLKKIELYNIGPYEGVNIFNIDVGKNNIVLIGGENGAGKTTFFNSIKTCLYGNNAWGFEAVCNAYYQTINALINNKVQYNNDVTAYIEVELYFNDGKEENKYLIHREWTKKKKVLSEQVLIKKNNEILSQEEQLDFNTYLLSVIPPDMFNFYFFDGESIADYFLGNNSGKNFKNAFLKLYGLDTLSVMVDNFERHAKKNEVSIKDRESYLEAKKSLEKVEGDIQKLDAELLQIDSELDKLQVEIASLKKAYAKEGGITAKEWKILNEQLVREESRREDINRRLKDIANNYLPFIIVSEELKQLVITLDKEQERQKNVYIKEVISKESFISKLDKLFAENEVNLAPASIINMICDMLEEPHGEKIFDFSPAQSNKVLSQIGEKLNYEKDEIDELVKQLDDSLSKTKQLREMLSNSTIDGYEEYLDNIQRIESKLLQYTKDREDKKLEKVFAEGTLVETQKILDKEKNKYELQLKNKSITDISSRAVAAYTLLEEELIRLQSSILQNEFIKSFSSIINKENFVDGIVVDKNINVIPYKMVNITIDKLDNYLDANKTSGFLDLFDAEYMRKIDKLRSGTIEEASLPSRIVSKFSMGERQVYIMSIYLALLKTSNKDIPFFIDTPFARIDSNHREKIVEEFFNGVTNQLFILSTDEEIVGKYEELIDARISNRFLLDINGYGKTTIVSNQYFGDII